ncbi:MAG: transcription termination/antitermination protein NusG [Lentisphaeria bacterium]
MQRSEKGQWFVIQTLSGQEFKVRDTIMRRKPIQGVDDKVIQVEVPTEKVSEVKRGQRTTRDRKFFPGYILVNAELYIADGDIDESVWYFIKEIEGVIGFVGGDKPVPLSEQEVERIVAQTQEAEEVSKPRVDFDIGETVAITEGPFENFEGAVEGVDPERGKLRLSVSIFGRSTPVEVEYWQVERT